MQNNKLTSRLGWKMLPTAQLENRLRRELKKEPPDDDVVLDLLHLLEQRTVGASSAASNPKITGRWIATAASLILVVGIFAALLPQRAQAESFIDILSRWTSDIFQLFSTDDTSNQSVDYVFTTDNPGLRQVYDAVCELGITDPVVPMWLPEGAVLAEMDVQKTPAQTILYARFSFNDYSVMFRINTVNEVKTKDYFTEGQEPTELEINGIIHNIMKNKEVWTVVWTRDHGECAIAADCQEDTLHRILYSIYVMEDN